jgi:hypothetical protein
MNAASTFLQVLDFRKIIISKIDFVGFEAIMSAEGDVVSGWKNKLQSAAALITPSDMLAEQHRKMAEPGSASK